MTLRCFNPSGSETFALCQHLKVEDPPLLIWEPGLLENPDLFSEFDELNFNLKLTELGRFVLAHIQPPEEPLKDCGSMINSGRQASPHPAALCATCTFFHD